jgi:hypothetical protein
VEFFQEAFAVAIPNHYLKRRDLLHSEKSSPALLSSVAKEFLAAERVSEALDFFEKARDTDGIQKIKSLALSTGDTFLLNRLERFDRSLVTQQDWDTAAQKAAAAGRGSMAQFLARKLAVAGAADAVAKPGEAPVPEV